MSSSSLSSRPTVSAEEMDNVFIKPLFLLSLTHSFSSVYLSCKCANDKGKLRYANNSQYKNDTMIRKEVRLFYATPFISRANAEFLIFRSFFSLHPSATCHRLCLTSLSASLRTAR
jgi:hypothetical protein